MKSTFYPAVRSVKQQGSAEFYSADILANPGPTQNGCGYFYGEP